MRNSFTLLLLLCCCVFRAAAQTIVQVSPAADAFVFGGGASNNYGADPVLLVRDAGTNIGLTRIQYLKFDLSSLPAGATINSAVLKLTTVSTGTSTGYNRVFLVTDDSWEEGTGTQAAPGATGITYNTRPPGSGSQISAKSVSVGAGSVTEHILTVTTRAEWAGDKILSLVITGNSNTVGQASKENPTEAYRPVLVLDIAGGEGGNQSPVSAFTATPTEGTAPLAVQFDGSASADADGTLASYAWDFGDGNTAAGATASHTYTSPGTFTARLTVTDNAGATAFSVKTIAVTEPAGNAAPVAAFTATPDAGPAPLTVQFDAAASADSDGTITGYNWDFGDGATATGAQTSHTFVAGSYTVTLTVTDNEGASGTVSRSVSVTTPPTASVYNPVADAWVRSGTFGNDNYGADQVLSVRDRASINGEGKEVFLKFDLTEVKAALAAGATLDNVTLRLYKIAGTGLVRLRQVADDGWQESTITYNNQPPAGTEMANPGLTSEETVKDISTSGLLGFVRAQTGSGGDGIVSVKITGNSNSYNLSSKENTQGFPAAELILEGVGLPAASAPPRASFTATPTEGVKPLNVAFDGSASTDPDGSVTAYDWDFGDGGTGSGPAVNHTYTSAAYSPPGSLSPTIRAKRLSSRSPS